MSATSGGETDPGGGARSSSAELPAGPREDARFEQPPDWTTIPHEVLCARCDYSLRMLIEPRCPECGLTFRWSDVLCESPESRELFEHRWRQRPFRSWARTALASFRPVRFWGNLRLFNRIKAGPLVVYLLLSALTLPAALTLTGALAVLILFLVDRSETRKVLATPATPSRFGLFSDNPFVETVSAAYAEAMLPWTAPAILLWSSLLVVVCLFGTLGALLILRQSMARCRVRAVHMLRTLAYSALPPLTLAGAFIAAQHLFEPWVWRYARVLETSRLFEFAPLTATIVLFSTYLGIGLRRYVRLPHAFLVAFSAVVVGVLFMMTVPAALFALMK